MIKCKLKDIAEITMGQSPKSEYLNCTGDGMPFLQGNRTFGYLFPVFDTYTTKVTKKAYAGDIIMSVRAPVGDLNITPVDMCLGRGVCSLRMKNGNQRYLYYLLKQNIPNLLNRGGGTTFASVNKDDIAALEINIDEENKQKQISDLLSEIDDKIENNNKINAELESLARTIYDYWFLQFEFPNEEGKPYKSSGGKMVWNEELKREIPDSWYTCKVRDCVKHINTGLNPRNNFVLNNGTIKYITVKNLNNDGTIDFNSCDTINEKARDIIHERSDISKGDILFASILPLGRCHILQETPKTWEINESVFAIRPDTEYCTSEYLYSVFTNESFVKKAEQNSTGSVFNGIRISTLENMNLVLPPQEIMRKYTDILNPIMVAKDKYGKGNQQLTSLRDFLLPLLMNGQVSFKKS